MTCGHRKINADKTWGMKIKLECNQFHDFRGEHSSEINNFSTFNPVMLLFSDSLKSRSETKLVNLVILETIVADLATNAGSKKVQSHPSKRK